MTSYYLHYAGSTFELPTREAAHEVIELVERAQSRDGGERREITLAAGGSIQIFVNRASQIAVSATP